MTDAPAGPWRPLGGRPTAWLPAASLRAASALAREALVLVGDAPWPALDVRPRGLRASVDGGEEAAAVERAAAALGVAAAPEPLQRLSVLLETDDPEAAARFWRAATGYAREGDALVDPLGRTPAIRLLPGAEHRPLRNRLHLDVSRPVELGRGAALELAPDRAPADGDWGWWVCAADPDGNEVDLAPTADADRLPGEGVDDWRALFAAQARWAGGREALLALVAEAADAADDAGLPLGIDVREGLVVLDSGKDLWEAPGFAALAARIQARARSLGLEPQPHGLRFVQLGLDAVDVPAVRAFWRDALRYEPDPREGVTDVVDPLLLEPPLFVQQMEADDTARRAQRGRLQVRLDVPLEAVPARIAAAEAAGGALLAADPAGGRWVLADPERNELHLHAGGVPAAARP